MLQKSITSTHSSNFRYAQYCIYADVQADPPEQVVLDAVQNSKM